MVTADEARLNEAELQDKDEAAAVEEAVARYKSETYACQYQREYLAGLALKNIRSRIIAHRELAVLRALLQGIDTDGRVLLDLPCGTGKLGRLMAEFAVRVVAADVSAEMMNLAKNEYPPDQLIRFVECDARKIPLGDGSVDVIVCLRLFQRLPLTARRQALREFRRLARKHLLISYSYDSPLQRIRQTVRPLYERGTGSAFSVGVKEIRSEIEDCGFRVERVKRVLPGLSSELVFQAAVVGAPGTGEKSGVVLRERCG